jgi:hypothetical protein
MTPAIAKRAPGSLAERFWSIARSGGAAGDDTTNPEPTAVVRHVLCILDALWAGEVGDGVSQATVSFLQMLRQQEQAGDLSYASPEQARGESLDERSLVFSVGVLLFEELTGRHPFGAMASGRRFARIQKCELGSGVQYFPQVPSQLRNMLMKAMGPFPEERYRSLAELRDVLERFVDGRPDETPSRLRRPLRGLPPTPADLAFAPVDEVMPTRILQRKPAPTAAAPAAAPRSPLAPLMKGPPMQQPMRAVSLLQQQQPSFGPPIPNVPAAAPVAGDGTDKLFPPHPTARAYLVLERVAYVACGALLALVAAYFALKPRHVAAPVAQLAAPAGEPARNVEPPSLQVAAAPPQAFDADIGGQNVAKASRGCFLADRAAKTIAFGIGVMWGKDEALSRRMFLSPDEPLSVDERKCVAHAMVGLAAGAAPTHATIVEYRLRLRPDGTSDVRAMVQK